MGIMDYFRKAEKDVMCPECEKHLYPELDGVE